MISSANSTRSYDAGVDIADLMTATDVARELGIQRRSVYHMARYLDGFPQPAVTLDRKPLWRAAEVKAWRSAHPARHQGRTKRGVRTSDVASDTFSGDRFESGESDKSETVT